MTQTEFELPIDDIHLNEKGRQFIIIITKDGLPVDISDASVRQIVFDKPEGNGVVVVNADFLTDGTDGKLAYTVISNQFFDLRGIWQIQGRANPSGKEIYSKVEEFRVLDNL